MNRKEKIEKYFEELEKNEEYSGTVLVCEGEEIILKDCFGVEDRILNNKTHIDSKYLIASITKSITAMAIMMLEQAGKLDTSDTIDKYIKDYSKGDTITIHHLLTHTAGLWQDPKLVETAQESRTLEETINNSKNKEQAFNPGQKFDYSNMGYTLLAYIIEKVSKQSYESFLQQHIFGPLKMENTGTRKDNAVENDITTGYIKDETTIIKADSWCLSNLTGAGDLYSTLGDLYKWIKELKSGRLLKEHYHQKLLTTYGHIYDNFFYGYGKICYQEDSEIKYYYQDGGLPGFKSIYVVYPKRELTIILLSNYKFVDTPTIINQIGHILYNEDNIFQID